MIEKAKPAVAEKTALDGAERTRLLTRIGIAGVLIVALIGALALFEQGQREPEPEPQSPESKSGPVGLPAAPASGSAKESGGPIASDAAIPKPEVPAEPERTAAPEVAKSAESAKSAEPAAEDSHPRLVLGKGGDAAAGPKPPVAESKLPPPPPAPAKAAVAEVPAKPAAAEAPPAARPGPGFMVQVGVFSSVANAEELRKKLSDAGIPAHIEARVQVGPFATQAEAAGAQKKLKAMGMEPGLLLPPRKP